MKIEKFTVQGLHGKKNYGIVIEDNKLILVAENGSGKTTLVNMLYYFLSRQWNKLNDYQFEKIIVRIDGLDYIYDKNRALTNLKFRRMFDDGANKRFPLRYKKVAEEIIENYLNIQKDSASIEYLATKYDVPIGMVHELLMTYHNEEHRTNENDLVNLEESLCEIFKEIQIVYLPTYRRIERDLKNIFPHLEENMKEYEMRKRRRNYHVPERYPEFVELVEFGMEDVKERISRRCQELRSNFYNKLNKNITGSYLEDILNKQYKNFDSNKTQSFKEEALTYLLKRLDDTIISQNGKSELKKFVKKVREQGAIKDEDKINAYFVWKLFQIYEEQQKEEQDINKFVDLCNEYLGEGKHLEYDRDNFSVDILIDDVDCGQTASQRDLFGLETPETKKGSIDYKDLSSGEKQIVSLFSHLILNKKQCFLIIDEPELSLSVPWQERILPDILNSGGCYGMLSVTHSPFIFRSNELKKHSHSLDEFLI